MSMHLGALPESAQYELDVMNLEDIAKLAGVSRSTVSRVINNDPNVSDRARTRVQATIDKVGYRPNAAARALASHRSHAIGLVVPEDFSQNHVDSWYPLMIEATLSATKKTNQSLVLIMEDTFADDAGKRVTTQFIDSGRVDGLLVLQHSYRGRDKLTPQLMEQNVPVVLIAESDLPGTSWVDNDNFGGGQIAARALAEAGVETVIAFAATEEHVPSRLRIEGFRSVFPEARVVYTDFSVQSAESVALEQLGPELPDAVFAVNGWIAPAIVTSAQQLGASIPEELKLIAFDDFDPDLSDFHNLTTIVQHVTQLADRAVNLLIDRVEGRAPPGQRIVLESVLIPRGSCNDRVDIPMQGGATRT